MPVEAHVAAVAAARAAGEAAGVPLVINARTDVFLDRAASSTRRSSAPARTCGAGADCVFVPGVSDLATLEQLVIKVRGPISVFGGAGGPTLDELARIGIPRVSYGPGPLGVAMAALDARREEPARRRRSARGAREPPVGPANLNGAWHRLGEGARRL